jgi:hypothetical protein
MLNKELMRIRVILPILFLAFSCNPDGDKEKIQETGYRIEELVLQDSVAKITIDIPMELDTFYTWVNWSDHNCGDIKTYTYSDSNYPASYKEGGSTKDAFPDSSYSFSLFHSNRFACTPQYRRDIDTVYLLERTASLERFHLSNGKDIEWIHREVKEINGRPFMIIAFRTNEQQNSSTQDKLIAQMSAFTHLDSLYIGFSYKCSPVDCDKFIPRMLKSLESTRIERLL